MADKSFEEVEKEQRKEGLEEEMKELIKGENNIAFFVEEIEKNYGVGNYNKIKDVLGKVNKERIVNFKANGEGNSEVIGEFSTLLNLGRKAYEEGNRKVSRAIYYLLRDWVRREESGNKGPNHKIESIKEEVRGIKPSRNKKIAIPLAFLGFLGIFLFGMGNMTGLAILDSPTTISSVGLTGFVLLLVALLFLAWER